MWIILQLVCLHLLRLTNKVSILWKKISNKNIEYKEMHIESMNTKYKISWNKRFQAQLKNWSDKFNIEEEA